jgi:hypothetical protein
MPSIGQIIKSKNIEINKVSKLIKSKQEINKILARIS